MLKKTTTNHNSTAGLNGSAAVSTRPTTLPDGGFDTVKNLNGDDVSLTEVVEAFCKSLYGTLDIPAGQRHTAIFSLSQQLAGWLGSDSVNSIMYTMRGIAPAYPDFVVDVQSGCTTQYRYRTVSYQLREVLVSYNIMRPSSSKSTASAAVVQGQSASATATAAPVQQTTTTADASPSASSGGAELLSVSTGDLPNEIWTCLPSVLQNCLLKIPHWMRAPFLLMLLPVLCMYVHASARDIDNVEMPLLLYNVCVGEASSGKSRLHKFLRKHFLKKILEEDEKERQKLETYKQQKQKANGSQTMSTARPDCGVRVVSKISTNMLLEYLKVANGRNHQPVLLMTDEISGLVAGKKQSTYTDLSQIIRSGYNADVISADSLSLQSSNLSVDVDLNVCIAGQLNYVLEFMGDVTDGSASRYLVGWLEQNMLERPVFGSLTDAEQNDIDKFLESLENFKANGPIELPRTKRVLTQWRDSIVQDLVAAQEAGLPFDKSRFSFSIRQATNALRASALLYIMNGGVEDARNERFGLWIAEEGLKNIYALCADQLNKVDTNIQTIKANRAAYQNSNTKLMALLPDEFNINDLQQAMGKLDLKNELQNAKTKCSELVKLKFAKHKSKGLWSKVKTTYKK